MCKFAIMKTSRIYHELNLDIVTAESDDVCYLLLPEKMKETAVTISPHTTANTGVVNPLSPG